MEVGIQLDLRQLEQPSEDVLPAVLAEKRDAARAVIDRLVDLEAGTATSLGASGFDARLAAVESEGG